MNMIFVDTHVDPAQVEVNTRVDEESGLLYGAIKLRADASKVTVFVTTLTEVDALEYALSQVRRFLTAYASADDHDDAPAHVVGAV